MKNAVLILNALFPYLTIACVMLLSRIGLWPLAALCALWGLLLALNLLFLRRRWLHPGGETLALPSMIIKLAQIPAFVAIFVIGLLTLAFPALPLILIALDFLAVVLTGLVAVGNVRQLSRKRLMGKTAALTLCLISFLFCADVAAAVIVWWMDRKDRTGAKAAV